MPRIIKNAVLPLFYHFLSASPSHSPPPPPHQERAQPTAAHQPGWPQTASLTSFPTTSPLHFCIKANPSSAQKFKKIYIILYLITIIFKDASTYSVLDAMTVNQWIVDPLLAAFPNHWLTVVDRLQQVTEVIAGMLWSVECSYNDGWCLVECS